MTHIPGHLPEKELSFISVSSLHRMYGYIHLADNSPAGEEFRIFFFNNTGYQFKSASSRVGFHLALFPIDREGVLGNVNAKFAAVAYDLADYDIHVSVEKECAGNGNIEDCSIAFIRRYISDGLPNSPDNKEKKKFILEQTCEFMGSFAFDQLYPHYKKDVHKWIRQNVVNLDDMTTKITGSANPVGNREITGVGDFSDFLKSQGMI